MYPNFYYLFQDLFGLEIEALQIVNTFGFFVAMGFLAANYAMVLEFKRKEREGELNSYFIEEIKGGKPNIPAYLVNLVLGFVIGFKLIWLLANIKSFENGPQEHIMSSEGSVFGGIIVALIFVGLKYYEDSKIAKKFPKPTKVKREFHPYEHMGTITLVAAISGMIGAKLFDHMEHWDEFVKNPLDAFLDPFSGLTFYGGLIFGAIAVLWYAGKKGIPYLKMLDIGAPAMMLAYAVGRIGCHMSGDGDWGIVNQASKPFSWMPDWFWAYDYPNNVAGICDPFTSAPCAAGAEVRLSAPVFPTPIYEVIACLILFGVIWSLRKRITIPGVLFFFYLTLNGLERFFIEKIRVNIKYHIGSIEITQAELISGGMILVGIGMMIYLIRRDKNKPAEEVV